MAACVVLHATGLTAAMRWLERSLATLGRSYWRQLRLLIAVAGWTVLVHLVEISVWAVYYAGGGGMPDLDSALYFSAVTYTTTGYGDLVLPEAVAPGRRHRGADRHPDVRLVDGLLLRDRQPDLHAGHEDPGPSPARD